MIDLNAIARRMHDALVEGLGEEGDDILAEADRLVPIEEGSLSRSGVVKQQELTVAVGYGSGLAASYAARQHEDMTLRHDAGRTPKFLEKPAMAAGSGMAKRLADKVEGSL